MALAPRPQRGQHLEHEGGIEEPDGTAARHSPRAAQVECYESVPGQDVETGGDHREGQAPTSDLGHHIAVHEKRWVGQQRRDEGGTDDPGHPRGARTAAEGRQPGCDQGHQGWGHPAEVHEVGVRVAHSRKLQPRRKAVEQPEAVERARAPGEKEASERGDPGPTEVK